MSGRAEQAYVAGLTLLARRELAEAQLRERLARRKFEPDDIDAAVARLRDEQAIDDRRTAVACARTQLQVKHRGRARVVQYIQSLGIDRDLAREAVAEVFGDVDEDELLEHALNRRLRHGMALSDPAVFRRVHRYLLGQGFDAGRVTALLRSRAKQ